MPPVEPKSTTERLMTIDEFAAEIGVTARTVRSHHARGLLQPPARIGRAPYYGVAHLVRMRTVIRLQSQGLPLEAIRALLDPDRVLGQFLLPGKPITAALRSEPELLRALVDSGVLVRRPDGVFAVASARAILAVRAASEPDTSLVEALYILADAVAAVRPHAEDALSRVRAEVLRRVPGGGHYRDELLELTVEALRLGVRACPA